MPAEEDIKPVVLAHSFIHFYSFIHSLAHSVDILMPVSFWILLHTLGIQQWTEPLPDLMVLTVVRETVTK